MDKMGFEVSVGVEPEVRWVPVVEAAARSYLEARSFPRRSIMHCLLAVDEAIEQLAGLCAARGVSTPIEVGFAEENDAVRIHIVYDANIPLNPHESPDYEMPSVAGDIDGLSASGLWLHIVKRSMDRVFFRIDGNRASLVLMKYRRDEGRDREAWVMGLRPRLRADLSLEFPPGEAVAPLPSGALLHDTRGRTALRLSASEAFIVGRFDGVNSLRDIYLDHSEEVGPISPLRMTQIYETLEVAGMLESGSISAESRRDRWARRLSPVFSIPHPDGAVAWAYSQTRFLCRPLGVFLMTIAGVSGVIPVYRHWDALGSALMHADKVFLQQPVLLAAAYVLLFVLIAVHELAHGVACKHFGGRVKQLGAMWYLAMFIFFCDTTSAWNFTSKRQRIWVSLAGPLASWTLWGGMAWCAGWTAASGSPWAAVWTLLLLMNSVSLIMNFNPLIRMDAYYMLVDWTGIPNLQTRALAYLKQAILSRFLHAGGPIENRPYNWKQAILSRFLGGFAGAATPISTRERTVFVVYGLMSAAMSLVFLGIPFIQLARLWIAQRGFGARSAFTLTVAAFVIVQILLKAGNLVYASRHREYKLC